VADKKDLSSYSTAFDSTRMGRVSIAVECINDEPHIAQSIMGRMIPIHTVYIPERESVLYLAISHYFDKLESDEIIPLYLSQYHTDGSVTFVRKDYKRAVTESTREQILQLMVENNVNMEEFKAWVRATQKATDDDFRNLDDNFLGILQIYIKRRE
jgi:hypothetical protein